MADDDEPTPAFARHSDPETSHAAAKRVARTKLERACYKALDDHKTWMTSLEVALYLNEDKWSISPRFKPLEERGLIERGKKVGLNSNGKPRNLTAWRVRKK